MGYTAGLILLIVIFPYFIIPYGLVYLKERPNQSYYKKRMLWSYFIVIAYIGFLGAILDYPLPILVASLLGNIMFAVLITPIIIVLMYLYQKNSH